MAKRWNDIRDGRPPYDGVDYNFKCKTGHDQKETAIVEVELKDGSRYKVWFNSCIGWEGWGTPTPAFKSSSVKKWRDLE